MTSHITRALATTDPLAEVFSDTSAIQAMLDVESALAKVQGRLGMIPAAAADAIVRAAVAADFDALALARDARASGTIAIPLVAALTERVRAVDSAAAGFVHWGATSQDIVDTALVRLVDRACAFLSEDHDRLGGALRALSDRHAGDVMLARTLLQPAPPITFGLKAAGWFAAEKRGWARVAQGRREAVILQFGGASGTLAAFGEEGLAVARELAAELGLVCPDAPWHPWRDRLAGFVAACGIYTGTLGKIARDVTLLMQFEVAEASEPGGGSSTMPHKRNPAGCATVLAAAERLPGLTAAMFAGLVQEHERSVGSWHAEWPIVTDAVQATGAALSAIGGVVESLAVNPARMRANIDATNGAVFAERAMMRAGRALGRDAAQRLVREALAQTGPGGLSLRDALRASPELAAALTDGELESIDDPRGYLGVADALRRRLLGDVPFE